MARFLAVAFVVAVGCGDNRVVDADAAIGSPDAAICTAEGCDDGDACTADLCDDGDGCRHVSLDRCAEPHCALGACAGLDTDGDGLSDAWETQGYVDVDCDGDNDGDGLDVQLPDADPSVPDVYLEIDYLEMAGSGAPCTDDDTCNLAVPGESCIAGVCTHSHKPRQASLDRARLAAARGLPPLPGDPEPPADLGGKPGFRIHWDAHSNAIPETPGVVVSFGTSRDSRELDPACVGPSALHYFDLKEANFYDTLATNPAFYEARKRIYHYAVAAHDSSCPADESGGNGFCNACPADRGGGTPQAGAGGTSEIPGNDFIVSLGDRFFGLGRAVLVIATEEAGTILHELGHNLGLGHGVGLVDGVPVPSLAPEYNPTYFSVMNYNYQFGLLFASAPGSAIPTATRLDYADDTVCANLVEASARESDGAQCGASSTRVVRYIPGTGTPVFGSATTGTAVDWNGDGAISSSIEPIDLNAMNGTNETFYTMNDWAHDGATFTNLGFDGFCLDWTVLDGPAPPEGLVLAEPRSSGR